MALLVDSQIGSFAESGYLILKNLVGETDVECANAEVDRLLDMAPLPPGHTGHYFYFQSSADSPALFDLVGRDGGVTEMAGKLVGTGGVAPAFDHAQVALNIPPNPRSPGRPHIDGYQPGQSVPGTFTLLAGLLLTDQPSEDCGNLWVWPGTHLRHAEFFAERGPGAFGDAAGYPDIDLPAPQQICGRRGDVLLAHYLLGHNIGGNYSTTTRRAIYWRLRAPGHAERWADCLEHPWTEYPSIRRFLDRPRTRPGNARSQLMR